jgi:hypothetical protein
MTGREPAQRESFLVRVWWRPGQAVQEVWIQHVRSGETVIVHGLDGIVTFIERWSPQPTPKEQQGLR